MHSVEPVAISSSLRPPPQESMYPPSSLEATIGPFKNVLLSSGLAYNNKIMSYLNLIPESVRYKDVERTKWNPPSFEFHSQEE